MRVDDEFHCTRSVLLHTHTHIANNMVSKSIGQVEGGSMSRPDSSYCKITCQDTRYRPTIYSVTKTTFTTVHAIFGIQFSIKSYIHYWGEG